MDLIVRDKKFQKKSVVMYPDYVCSVGSYGSSDNDFILTQPLSDNLLSIGDILTYGTTEFGGKILDRVINTELQTVQYIGKTFRGVFDNFVIGRNVFYIDAGTDELIVNRLLKYNGIGLNETYSVTGTGKNKSSSTFFDKGTTLHQSIDWFLRYFEEKAVITVDSSGVKINLLPIQRIEKSEHNANVIIDENKLLPTALFSNVYAGRAFLQGDGSFSNTSRYYKGLDAVEIWEEFPSGMENPTEQECFDWAKDRLLSIRQQQLTSEVFFDVETADIGDVITAIAPEYGISTSKTIIEKVLKIQDGNEEIVFKLGG